jgi:hypothetical protein
MLVQPTLFMKIIAFPRILEASLFKHINSRKKNLIYVQENMEQI